MTASGLSELSVRQLLARRRRLGSGVADPEGTLRGVVLSEGRRCSSAGCRCRRGELHGPYTYLATYGDRRSRMIYVPAVTAEVVEEFKGPKIEIHLFKNKTGYHRRQGFRSRLTTLRVTGIETEKK